VVWISDSQWEATSYFASGGVVIDDENDQRLRNFAPCSIPIGNPALSIHFIFAIINIVDVDVIIITAWTYRLKYLVQRRIQIRIQNSFWSGWTCRSWAEWFW
jgi:hypothetical protein